VVRMLLGAGGDQGGPVVLLTFVDGDAVHADMSALKGTSTVLAFGAEISSLRGLYRPAVEAMPRDGCHSRLRSEIPLKV
jgi:hypothetical protein